MAIIQHPVNGDIVALKDALEATGFFDHFSYDDDENPTVLFCYDSDNNLLFQVEAWVEQGVNAFWRYKVYKSSGQYVEASGAAQKNTSTKYGVPTSLYIVGSKAAILHFQNSASGAAFIAIGITNNGVVGFATPSEYLNNSTGGRENSSVNVCSWDDDGSMSTALRIADANTPMVGNSVQFVPIPMHGVYGTPEFLENVYYMPMVQDGMRNSVQEIAASDGNVYFTNGFIAAYDDVGLTT